MHRIKTFPRVDIHYCYICDGEIQTHRIEGDWELQEKSGIEEAKKGGYSVSTLDIQSVLCGKEECLRRYEALPKVECFQYRPLVREGQFWDGGSIFGFTKRTSRQEISEETDPLPINQEYRGKNAYQLEPLFQEWLFFGLLNEILGLRYSREDYVEGIYLSMRKLNDNLFQWVLSRPEQDNFNRLREAIYLVRRMLGAVKIQRSFSEDLMAFIALCAEMCWSAIESVFVTPELPGFGLLLPSWHQKRLTELGWCPYEAESAVERKTSLTEQAALACIERKVIGHDGCNSERCNLPNGKTSHRPGCQVCEMVRIEESQMLEIRTMLEEDTFPLFTFGESLKLSKHEAGVEFCAISHVWTQGMGNEEDNALNRCQLKFLSSLTTLPIWIDTICCPVERRIGKRLKNVALGMMRKIYSTASFGLVIDTELVEIETLSMSPVELGMRVFLSSWVFRLWTFQEGSLVKQLRIGFKDRILDLHSLWLALRDKRRSRNFVDRQLAGVLIAFYNPMRAVGGHLQAMTRQQLVPHVTFALGRRKVTYAKDEALCIATLLDLDVGEVLKYNDHESRMKVIWQSFSGLNLINRTLIFYSAQTLSLPGYSWAYSTFLQRAAIPCFSSNTPDPATITDQGLVFCASGFSFVVGEMVPGLKTSYSMKTLNCVYIKSRYQWWMFTTMDEDRTPLWEVLSSGLVILSRYLLGSPKHSEDGACVLVKVKQAGHCSRVRYGSMRRVGKAENANMVLAFAHAEKLRTHEEFLLLTSTNDLRAQYQKCNQLLSFDPGLLQQEEIPQEIRDIGPSIQFDSCVLFMLAGEYAVVVEEFDEQREWCIG